MPSTQALKTRIRSVKNTKQITKAMQLVAASKMRRAQEADKASAPYTRAATELLTYLASQGVTDRHPLFEVRQVRARLLIVIAADKGLAGFDPEEPPIEPLRWRDRHDDIPGDEAHGCRG